MDLAVFTSYCHDDRRWLEELRPHLQILEDELDIPFWDDTKTPPGLVWLDLIKNTIDCSAIIICLLSANYFSSRFIKNVELDLIREANARGALLFPLYVTPFSLHPDHWFYQLQGVNSPEQTLVAMTEAERDSLYSRTVELLRVALSEKRQTPTQVPEPLIEEASPMSEPAKDQETHAHESARYNIAVVGRTVSVNRN